jgi:general secretion pathway protein C
MASKRKSKKSISKIPSKTAQRIMAVSFQHPELGARRLVPLLKKKRISLSAAAIQSILRSYGLQSREKRLAKLEKRSPKSRQRKLQPKKPSAKITDEAAERIVEISLQNPDFGARRLMSLLKKERIRVPASRVYSVLKRHGLQFRAARMAKLEERTQATRKPKSPPQKPAAEITASPVFIPKTFPKKIPSKVENRIIDLSLQNPGYGARRLTPLLKQEEIFVSASAVYTILKRNNLENRQKRLLKIEAQPSIVALAETAAKGLEPFAEPAGTKPTPAEGEIPRAIFEFAAAAPIAAEDELLAPAEISEPISKPAMAALAGVKRTPLGKASGKFIKKGSDWVFYSLYLLLFVLIGYLGFLAVQAIQYAGLETRTVTTADSPTPGISAKTENAGSQRPLEGYRKIWERNLFNIALTGNSKSSEKISLDKIVLAKKDLGLELVGTVVADDPQWSRAIIDNRKTREQEVYREGDKAGEVRIKKILRNNVVITTAEGDELLTVEIKETAKRSTSYSAAQYVGSRSASAPQASGSATVPARTLSLNLKRDEVAAAFTDTDEFIKQLRIIPYNPGDQPSGFMISSIMPQNVLRKMGLRSRDVITGINGEAITGPEQAADFFERLSRGGEVTINFQRRRRNRQIRLNIE